jgi:hypothetical protein
MKSEINQIKDDNNLYESQAKNLQLLQEEIVNFVVNITHNLGKIIFQ